jgi:hypothetical protein
LKLGPEQLSHFQGCEVLLMSTLLMFVVYRKTWLFQPSSAIFQSWNVHWQW